MSYPQAIFQTLTSMGPYYASAIYSWFKMAVWDAPYRFVLDVQLEKIGIERNLSMDLDRRETESQCSNS